MTPRADILSVQETVSRAVQQWACLRHGAQENNPHTDRHDSWWMEVPSGVVGATLSLPNLSLAASVRWFGPRLILWPAGLPQKRISSICSSAIGKRKDRRPEWFDALRTAALRLDAATECLVHVESTATSPAVRRCCDLFGIDRLRIALDREPSIDVLQLKGWLQRMVETHVEAENDCNVKRAILSPMVGGIPPSETDGTQMVSADLLADAMLIAAGQRIVALQVRRRGRIAAVLRRYLADPDTTAAVLLAVHGGDRETADYSDLVEAGAVRWLLHSDRPSISDRTGPAKADRVAGEEEYGPAVNSAGPGPAWDVAHDVLTNPDEWLCHWTRARSGPWRHQPDDDYWDELILGCRSADRSAFAALLKILEDRVLFAAPIGQGRRCVSFTAVPLQQFWSRRVFRRHKQQFDFEPYGIAVRRSVLEQRGARPVVYVKPELFDDVDPHQQHLRQPTTNAGGTIDWTAECEWRLLGDLDFSPCSVEDLAVFAADAHEVRRLQLRCPWPVVRVPPV